MMMGSEVTLLFDNFLRVLKNAKDECKFGIMASLKSLMDNLNFASVQNFDRTHVTSNEVGTVQNI